MTELTKVQLKQLLPKNPYINQWHHALSILLPDYEINTPQRIAAFMAQCAHESGEFVFLSENLNYKPATLRKIFSKYFPDDAIANDYCSRPTKQKQSLTVSMLTVWEMAQKNLVMVIDTVVED